MLVISGLIVAFIDSNPGLHIGPTGKPLTQLPLVLYGLHKSNSLYVKPDQSSVLTA